MGLKTVRLLLFAIFAFAPAAFPAISVDLSASLSSPAPVGSVVTWTARATDTAPGTLWYRFRGWRIGLDPRVIVDYGPKNTLDWTAGDHEGWFEIEVSVRNLVTGEQTSTSAYFEFTPLATGDGPALTPTANPFVWIYSTPPCPSGSQMRVEFRSPAGLVGSTDSRSCVEGVSMNFYLAGMRAETAYTLRHVIETKGGQLFGPELALTTKAADLNLAPYTVVKPAPLPWVNGILLQSCLAQTTVATDLAGNPVWAYWGDISFLTSPSGAGRFLGIHWDTTAPPSQQVVREFDLAGITIQETNAARVSEQLIRMGIRPITGFHHEAKRLPNGDLLVLASTEQILTDVQDPGPVDVIGDTILVLDRNLQVLWVWDSFDHLDVRRKAVMGETCTPGGGGCPPFYLAPVANDWVHGNSLELTADGNILYSARHQDWVIKIDYRNGQGTGNVLWRLGKDGDFSYLSSDPYPWFSHQHDARHLSSWPYKITLFDNGNTRRSIDPGAHSRGQVIQLDEANRTAVLLLNAGLGVYSPAVGSAQLLPNGNYHFDAGFVAGPAGGSNVSHAFEVDSTGSLVYDLQVDTPEYRAFRMKDLYTW